MQGRSFGKHESFTIDIIHAGREDCKSNHEFGGIRSYYLVHVVTSGKGWFGNTHGQWELGPGQAFVITPRDRHLYQADGIDPWSYFWVGFDISGWKMLESAGISPSNPVLRFPQATVEHLQSIWDDIMSIEKESDPLSHLRLTTCACLFLSCITTEGSPGQDMKESQQPYTTELHLGSPDNGKSHVHSMCMFIHHHVQSTISPKDVVAFAGLERSYASRIFKLHTGVSLSTYLLKERMELAVKLLGSGLSAKETGYSVGYRSYEHFLKMFKQYWGDNPSHYKIIQEPITH